MHTSLANISPAQLRRAANLKEQIAKLEKEIGSILGNSSATADRTPKRNSGIRRKMSAAARAKISAIAKARWAKAKKAGKKRL